MEMTSVLVFVVIVGFIAFALGFFAASLCSVSKRADKDAKWISTGYALVDHVRGSIIVLQEREYYRLFNLIRPAVIGDDSNG